MSKNSNLEEIRSLNYNALNRKEDIPAYFFEINKLIFNDGRPDSDLETVRLLGVWLKNNIKGGPGLSEPSAEALQIMLAGKGGVCSDMAQVFNNFCVVNDIAVREWGTTSAPFNRDFGGHSFNEVYCGDLQKWILVDVYWNFMFYNDEGAPLSVVELYQMKRLGQPIFFKSFNEDNMVEEATVNKNYLNSSITPFLICGYHNKIYDRYLSVLRPHLPIFIIHFILFALNKSYHYRFPFDNYKAIFS
ncbi:hypothetical protein M0G43_04795 [Subsaxibacter sp. CAU 1640]|uniref:transglutaminase domain-containing protein n=1 Tax=Subsaxibacter sp. CAU 1640 TaxID=2933271 RepID=UPI002004BB6E|nr:transglutaminase domain-containing protein [Subsaxibacter sp. CAU 1640]MCK7589883.1 hypothetical protein [Subsaxibacter sp. CAU 1640]